MRSHLKALRHNGDFRIVFSYADGLVAELDFGQYVEMEQGPVVEALQDEQFFDQAFVDHGALTWPSGYDVCPDVLRFWCEQGRVCSHEETDAYFLHALPRAEPAGK